MSNTKFPPLDAQSTDCVVVGGGAAGLRAAIECRARGFQVVVVSKGVIGQSHSLLAQGGVNAALAERDADDSWEKHAADTMRAGRFINHPQLVNQLCQEVPERLYDLVGFGAGLERGSGGQILQVAQGSGGQSRNRVVAVGDYIGAVMQRALVREALKVGVVVMDETTALRLIRGRNQEPAGLLAVNLRRGEFVLLEARAFVVAAGGAGQLFWRTTNPTETTGDAYVLAFLAGCELADLEMVQFHPTALAGGTQSSQGLLVTEAARGLGGLLRNGEGDRFMSEYHPDGELAPRDVVSRAITSEVRAGRGSPAGGAYLDITHLSDEVIAMRLQTVARVVRTHQGRDVRAEWFEISPAAHHLMGGIVPTNVETMEASPRIFVAGEAAWGVHGANRIGGNALAETQVFGFRAGRAAADRCNDTFAGRARDDLGEVFNSAPLSFFTAANRAAQSANASGRVAQIRGSIQKAMSHNFGVVRTHAGLHQVLSLLADSKECLETLNYSACSFRDRMAGVETWQMASLGELAVSAGLCRRESRGAHFREDHKEELIETVNTRLSSSRSVRAEPTPRT